jgi:hypothetical protein
MSRGTSEHFARGFEKIPADGVAPSPEMKLRLIISKMDEIIVELPP